MAILVATAVSTCKVSWQFCTTLYLHYSVLFTVITVRFFLLVLYMLSHVNSRMGGGGGGGATPTKFPVHIGLCRPRDGYPQLLTVKAN